jgi:uncharacterized membrane protein YebE (DUF533 family)
MKKKIYLTMVAFTAICFIASAQQGNTQKERVKQGVKSGEVTKEEAAGIREERKEVRATVKDAKSDGVVTKEEKKEIKEQRKETNKAVVRAKNNGKKVN